MAYFKFPQESIDTTGLATDTKQDSIITELQSIVSNTNDMNYELEAEGSTIAALPNSSTDPAQIIAAASLTNDVKAIHVIDTYGVFLNWYTGATAAAAAAAGVKYVSAPGCDTIYHGNFPATENLYVRAKFAGDGSPSGGQLSAQAYS